MAYSIKRKESVERAVRRLARQQTEHALECLRQVDRAKAIHCARKDIKKTRALLHLVRPWIVKRNYRRLTKLLRHASAALAAPRDAYIKLQTLRHLKESRKGNLAPKVWQTAQMALKKDHQREIRRFGKEETAVVVEKTLHRCAKICDRLKVPGKGWKALNPGVETSYRRGRRAFHSAMKDASPKIIHSWRKSAKDLSYHLRVLRRSWRKPMMAVESELMTLCDLLGDHHDLTVLHLDLAQRPVPSKHDRAWEAINGLIKDRQDELQADALALGKRLYAEKPSLFCDRMAVYWKTWRNSPKS